MSHDIHFHSIAKPSYGWGYNVKYPTYPNYSAVVPCRRDGYTRINQMPGRPSLSPTAVSMHYVCMYGMVWYGELAKQVQCALLYIRSPLACQVRVPHPSYPVRNPLEVSDNCNLISIYLDDCNEICDNPSSIAPTYKNTVRPTVLQTASPTYRYNPTQFPTQQPSVYNSSLLNHSLPILRFESVLTVNGVYYSAKILFDNLCQVTTSVNFIV